MRIASQSKNKLGIIDRSYPKLETKSLSLLYWGRSNAILLAWIMNSVAKELFPDIFYSKC